MVRQIHSGVELSLESGQMAPTARRGLLGGEGVLRPNGGADDQDLVGDGDDHLGHGPSTYAAVVAGPVAVFNA